MRCLGLELATLNLCLITQSLDLGLTTQNLALGLSTQSHCLELIIQSFGLGLELVIPSPVLEIVTQERRSSLGEYHSRSWLASLLGFVPQVWGL